MNILLVNTADIGGGAEAVAMNLLRSGNDAGHNLHLGVGIKRGDDPRVLEVRHHKGKGLLRTLSATAQMLRRLGQRGACFAGARLLERLANPKRLKEYLSGKDESVDTAGWLEMPTRLPAAPDVIHLHNLHGWYFDLEVLPQLSRQAPLVLTMHDPWALTGHCACFLDCPQFQQGCTHCPHRSWYPSVLQDQCAYNRQHKQQLLAQSLSHITVPATYMKSLLAASPLANIPCSVIPNGVDTQVFNPGEGQRAARAALNLPQDIPVVLFAAAQKRSIYKDYHTLWEAADRFLQRFSNAMILCVGFGQGGMLATHPQLRFLPFIQDRKTMAQCYQAATLFWHATNAESFGLTVTESLACGTPVVATGIDGIVDQLQDGINGYTVRPKNPDDFVECSRKYLEMTPEEQQSLRENAARTGAGFSQHRQTQSFLQLYQQLAEEASKR